MQSEWDESVRADLGSVFPLGQSLCPIVWGNLFNLGQKKKERKIRNLMGLRCVH